MVTQMQQGKSEEEILQGEKALEAAAERDAQNNLRRFFLSRKICTDADCFPSEEEVRQQTAQLMMYDRQAVAAKSPEETQQLYQAYTQQAFIQLVQKNAEDHLLAA